jgi:hypothetical protein
MGSAIWETPATLHLAFFGTLSSATIDESRRLIIRAAFKSPLSMRNQFHISETHNTNMERDGAMLLCTQEFFLLFFCAR